MKINTSHLSAILPGLYLHRLKYAILISTLSQMDRGLKPVKHRRASVTICDDVSLNRIILQRQLQRHTPDVEIQQACDGSEVLSPRTDIVFMDVNMPGTNGIEATKIIRKKSADKGKKGPVIIGFSTDECSRDECLDAGMDDFLKKPATQKEIAKMIEKWDLVEHP